MAKMDNSETTAVLIFDYLVDRVIDIYKQYPEITKSFRGTSAHAEMYRIGEILNAIGGMRYMYEATERLGSRRNDVYELANLTHIWSGIGDWVA